MSDAPKIFISYCHVDTAYLDSLNRFLKPLQRDGVVDAWSDKRIKIGQDWKAEIEKALEAAKVAVFLVSQDFLASDFINDVELPTMIEAAEKRGVILMSVILGHCQFSRNTELYKRQAVNSPGSPLAEMTSSQQDKEWLKLTTAIEEALQNPR